MAMGVFSLRMSQVSIYIPYIHTYIYLYMSWPFPALNTKNLGPGTLNPKLKPS